MKRRNIKLAKRAFASLFLIVPVISLSTYASQCNTIDSNYTENKNIEIKENVLRIEKNWPTEKISEIIEKSEQILVFNFESKLNTSSIERLKIGTVLYGYKFPNEDSFSEEVSKKLEVVFPSGVFIKILKVDRGAITLKQASLEDVIEKGKLRFTVNTCMYSEEKNQFKFYKAAMESAPLCSDNSKKFQNEINGELSYGENIKAKINYRLMLKFDHIYEFKEGKLANASLSLDYCDYGSIDLDIKANVRKKLHVWDKMMGPYTINAGWFPIVVSVKNNLDFLISSSANINASPLFMLGNEKHGDLNYEGDAWKTNLDSDAFLQFDIGEFKPKVETTASFIPSIYIEIYGLAGPFLEGKMSASAKVNTELNPKSGYDIVGELDLGIDAGIRYRFFTSNDEIKKSVFNLKCALPEKDDVLECNQPGFLNISSGI